MSVRGPAPGGNSPDGQPADTLDQVVVTATRTPKSLKDVPVVTRVLTADDIRKADATNVQDLLTAELPGLEFGYARNQERSLNLSGFGGNAVLFLVDGERLAGETMDNVDYNRLDLDNIARVEVVKGAASALYGANAVGGVVNLISRESTEPWTAKVSGRYSGQGDELRNGASFGFNLGKVNSQTSFQRTTVRTVRLTDPFDALSEIHEIWGGRVLDFKERLILQASDKVRLVARGGWYSRWSERGTYDDLYTDRSAGLKALCDFGQGRSLDLSYSFDQYDKARFVSGLRTHDHDYSNRQNSVHLLYNRSFAANTLTLGADFLDDFLKTYQFTGDGRRDQRSVDAFAQFDWNPLKWLNAVGSVRYDRFSASKSDALTSRLAMMLKSGGFSLRVSYSGGFRAPTLKEMYMDFDMVGIMMVYGNPSLKPERSRNFNLALEKGGRVLGGTYDLTLSGHHNIYRDRITAADFAGDSEREKGLLYTNESRLDVSSLDFSGIFRSETGLGLKLGCNILRTSARSVESQFTLPRPFSATWRLDYDKRLGSGYSFNAALSGRFLSRPETDEPSDGAYSVWKLSFQQKIRSFVAVNLAVDNLLGYRPEVYYFNSLPTIGRTFSVALVIDLDKISSKR